MRILLLLSRVFNSKSIVKTKQTLRQAGVNWDARTFLGSLLAASALFSILAFLAFASEFPLSLAYSLLTFALSMLAFRQIPSMLSRRRALNIESDLPPAMRSLAAQLSMRIPFEHALRNIGSASYSCSPEFVLIADEVQTAASIKCALASSAERIDSLTYKRAIAALSEIYAQGSGASALKRLADDLISQQLSAERHFSSRVALASILFIAAACIVPSLLLAYLLVGSSFLSLTVQPLQIWLLFLVGFPAVNLAIIAYLRMGAPPHSLTLALPRPISDAEFTALGQPAGLSASSMKRRLALVFISCLLLAAACILFVLLPEAAFFFALPFLYYFYLHYALERRNRELEKYLPDALLHAAALERGTSTERMLDSLATAGYGLLSQEFAQVSNSVKAGASVPSALNAMANRSQSLLLKRAAWLMAAGYSVGSEAYASLREAADDILSVFLLLRERSALASMQKYTLLAGAILVPLILGTLLGAILKLDIVSFTFDEVGALNAQGIRDAAAGAAPAYILIYTFLSSLLIAQLEGSWRRFVPYVVVLAPLSLGLFELARTTPLFAALA
ncbi:MAG: type II secretion system F family protein [Candidatus Burarchaeum sp.]|nr:type II secretion system F family protein [Candidatus Burarchaeum sp.]MDO8339033.1 type II secretion system F family protein [Candidatus Burarchaeum sp.]